MKLLLSFLLITATTHAAPRFAIPASASLHWTGFDAVSGDTCSLEIATDEGGWISSFILQSTFKGFALATPRDMTPTGSGYYGVVDLFQNYSYSLFRYEDHVFRTGITLVAPGSRPGSDKRKASLFGPSLTELERVTYQDHNAFIQLDGECKNLVLAP